MFNDSKILRGLPGGLKRERRLPEHMGAAFSYTFSNFGRLRALAALAPSFTTNCRLAFPFPLGAWLFVVAPLA